MAKLNLIGNRYGRLLVISKTTGPSTKHSYWECQCDCGNAHTVKGGNLVVGNTNSCGCFRRERITKMNKEVSHNRTHGMSGTRDYDGWLAMKARCNSKSYHSPHRYSERGISVCKRWVESFENYFSDMGPKPDGMTLERIDNSKGYSKENCKWASMKEQSSNRF